MSSSRTTRIKKCNTIMHIKKKKWICYNQKKSLNKYFLLHIKRKLCSQFYSNKHLVVFKILHNVYDSKSKTIKVKLKDQL